MSSPALDAGCEVLSQPPKVLLISPQPFYEDRGTPIALRYVASALSDLGFSVDIVTFPVGADVEIPRVRIHRTPNPFGFRHVPIGLSWRKVFLDCLLFWKVRRMLKRGHYQYIHAVEEGIFIALCLRRDGREYLVYDMQSSLPEQLSQHGLFRSRAIAAVLDRIERYTLRSVDSVACSAGLAGRVRAAGGKGRVHEWWFPVTGERSPRDHDPALRRELRIPEDAKVFLYAGSFAGYQGLDTVIAAIPDVVAQNPQAFFVLVGAASDAELGLGSNLPAASRERLRVVPRRSRDRVQSYIAIADFLLLPRTTGRNVPLKIFEYMASGKPIIASRTPPHEALLDGSRASFFDHSAPALSQTMLSLMADWQQASMLGTAAQRYAEEVLTWGKFVQLIERIYNLVAI